MDKEGVRARHAGRGFVCARAKGGRRTKISPSPHF